MNNYTENSTSGSTLASLCSWDKNDKRYGGAAEVVNKEYESIKQRRPQATQESLTGLALSGGGIRSSTFCLGVMQALAHKNLLAKFDYLSTVSGGGYIGTSLTWLLHKKWTYNNDGTPTEISFGLGPENFPYKTQPICSMDGPSSVTTLATEEGSVPNQAKGSMLRWLRQHAKYLTPGGTHTLTTLVAVFLRSSLPNLLFYFAPLALLMTAFISLNFFTGVDWFFNAERPLAPALLITSAWLFVIFGAASLIYCVLTFVMQSKSGPRNGRASDYYRWRRHAEASYKRLLSLVGIAFCLGIIPWIPHLISNISGLGLDALSNVLSVVSTVAGIAMSIAMYLQSNDPKTPKNMGKLAVFGAAFLLFGYVLLAYQTAGWILETLVINASAGYSAIGVLLAVTAAAFFNNLNYVSVHRYYRDRLMETFMPDVANAVKTAKNDPATSHEANTLAIQNAIDEQQPVCGPYHLINTNVILVNSDRPKFRGRGGDNFILSPLFCGSSATDWRSSDKFMDGQMTLATAMAISGAAVNPKTGCGGHGITRNPLVSMLMGLLNIRLGYWALNPKQKPNKRRFSPNAIWPGLGELILNRYLNEDSKYIQLSDGGHFENLGIYELIRRRLKLIVVCDGGADPDYTFADLANVIEKARTDFGALIMVDDTILSSVIPRHFAAKNSSDRTEVFARRGYFVADIIYAQLPDEKESLVGRLVYLTTTFTKHLNADLYSYRKEHKEFPDEPTSDQFFDERQFEAYRELGFQLAWNMIGAVQPNDDLYEVFRRDTSVTTERQRTFIPPEGSDQIIPERIVAKKKDEGKGPQDNRGR